MQVTTLYKKGAHGTNVWTIWSDGPEIVWEANGSIYKEIISRGLAGRSIAQQVELRMEARIRGKLDEGFKRTKEESEGEVTNQLGLFAPMLATPLKNVRIKPKALYFIQPKFDGHRCLINSKGAYSRRGKVIDTIPEIINSLNIPDNITLDGELYLHGVPLQTISSWAKRRQENTKKLEFHIYDVIMHDDLDMSFDNRLEVIREIEGHNVVQVDTKVLNKDRPIIEYWSDHRDQGYEGSIIRLASNRYGIGKRSKELIKVKMRSDEEFTCVDVIPSREGWGILVLETKEGKKFKTNAPGSYYEKQETLDNKQKYISKPITCEFADKTLDGIPFHCVAIRWKEHL